jgi:hypothetical protein
MEKFYTSEVEHFMRLHYQQLSSKEKRQYAAIEVLRLKFHGRKMYISKLLNISRGTIEAGIKELTSPSSYEPIPIGKERRSGGGRKKNL